MTTTPTPTAPPRPRSRRPRPTFRRVAWRAARIRAGLTVVELATAIRCDLRTVQGWERHERPAPDAVQLWNATIALNRARTARGIPPVCIHDFADTPSLGERIRCSRRALGHTRERFAELLGVGAAAVARWEQDHSAPAPAAFRRLCELTREPASTFQSDEVRPAGSVTTSPAYAVTSFRRAAWRAARIGSGLSIEDVVEATGATWGTVWRWETGIRPNPRPALLVAALAVVNEGLRRRGRPAVPMARLWTTPKHAGAARGAGSSWVEDGCSDARTRCQPRKQAQFGRKERMDADQRGPWTRE